MRVRTVVQARMGSTRLPGKMLIDLGGHRVLEYLCEEMARSRLCADLVVATTVDPGDDPIAECCHGLGIACLRGAVYDVLSRFVAIADDCGAAHLVRMTGDNPMLPAAIADMAVQRHLDAGADYTFTGAYYSGLAPTFPDGWDVEVLHADALRAIDAQASDPLDREHVTRLALRGGVDLELQPLEAPPAYRYPEVKLTLDEPADLELLKSHYRAIESGEVDRLELPRYISERQSQGTGP